MKGRASARNALLASFAFALALATFAGLYAIHHDGALRSIGVAAVACAFACVAAAALRRRVEGSWLAVALAAGVLGGFALCTAFQLQPYLLLPVDLLAFSESPFVTDVIKLRLGEPLYTPAGDNDSFPYSPGAQLLTYALAHLAGGATSIPVWRCIQFGYVLAAVAVSVRTVRSLVRDCASSVQAPWLWCALAAPFLFLVATDPRVNPYTHTLHNDGLALLLSACALALLVEHSRAPRKWHVVAMAILPAAGFFVKQSALFWIGPFAVQLAVTRAGPRKVLAYVACASALVAALVAACWCAWGAPYLEWTFGALGVKQVALARSFDHTLEASGYLALGFAAGTALVFLPGRARYLWPWLACVVLFAVEAYTSGIASVSNHLGPAALLLSTWFVAALANAWRASAHLAKGAAQVAQAALPCALAAGLGLVRAPVDLVPKDVERYVAAIEAEFKGFDAHDVLLDQGSWIYLREGVLMKDRSAPVSLRVGANQPEISRAALSETIERIRSKRYAKILAREIDTPASRYDFGERGSGVKQAILESYRIVRRIPPVANVRVWWPKHLLAEVDVLEPR